ncbi:MAG: MFS transporter [Hyphomicrobiales bacterium]|nr:MFS transporter [Hyphomicrobiales bacterium]
MCKQHAPGRQKAEPGLGPRSIVQLGFATTLVAIVLLFAVMQPGLGSRAVLAPLFVMGLGIGLLAGQIANVIQSSVGLEHSGQAGGLQYTSQYFGSSLGTALIGAVMLGTLASAALDGFQSNPAFRDSVREAATVEVAHGVSFVSDQALKEYLDGIQLAEAERRAVLDINVDARLRALRSGMVTVAFLALIALLCTGLLPKGLPRAGAPPEEKAS